MTNTDKSQKRQHTSPRTMLSDEQVVDHLKACQRLAVAWVRPCFDDFSTRFSDKLLEFGDRAKTNKEQERYFEYQRELAKKRSDFERYFCGYFGEGYIKFKNKDLNTHTGEEKYSEDMLSLVDNEDLEETIAIGSITQRMENYHAEILWAINQRFAILNGGDKVDDRSNPLGPVQFCESLRKALSLFEFDTTVKIIAYKIFDQAFMSRLQEVLDETNRYLIDTGILKNLRASAPAPTNTAPPPPMPFVEGFGDEGDLGGGVYAESAQAQVSMPLGANTSSQTLPNQPIGLSQGAPIYGSLPPLQDGVVAAPDPNLPSDQYQGNLLNAIHTLQTHITEQLPQQGQVGQVQSAGSVSAVPANTAAAGRPSVTYSSQQLVSALQNLQVQSAAISEQFKQASQGDLPLQNISAMNSLLTQQLLSESEDGALAHGDMHTIDLVGMLFEYMLSDDNLPDSVKALLSYLHTPFMKLAFLDKDFFEQAEHPARLLLNNLAEAGVRWVSNDGTSQYDVYDKIKSSVSRVLEEFKNDVRLFAELLLEFSGHTKKIARRQELTERRATEKVEGEEKLREVKVRVNNEVRTRTDERELPSVVLLLLLQPWSDYLAFILLRYGDESETWKRSIIVIDNILWSIEPKLNDEDKARQKDMHDDLLDTIETGFETIGYDQAKGRKLLDAFVSLQKLAQQSKKVEIAPAPMRDKLEALAAEKAGHDIAEEEEAATEEETKMVENLKMIEFGTWFEFEGGKRLKVAWYNARTMHYMLVDQMGKKVAMKSGLQLARSMIAKDCKIIAGSSKPFFERALENIFQNLNSKAADAKVLEGGGDE